MTSVLVVEDSRMQAARIVLVLEEAGYDVRTATDGETALESITTCPPEIVLTDLMMPGVNGLELTETVRSLRPSIPVVLMTANGSEAIAAEALRKGASGYIPKSQLDRSLLSTIGQLAEVLETRRQEARILERLTESACTFRFGNDHDFVGQLVSHLQRDLQNVAFEDQTGLLRIVLALKEALLNAIDHGNLELDSSLRDEDDDRYRMLGEERKRMDPYRHRNVQIVAKIRPERVTYVIRDEGPGFDPSKVPDPTDPENLVRAHGRGLMLIQSFMDEVSFNESGNEITMVKHREKSMSA